MPGHECYHCKQWVEEGEAHDCWTTTERALTQDLSEDLRDAWERLREAASELGEQRIYASHNSIMFARKTCYAFVRPKRSFLEVVIFLGRAVKSPRIKKVVESSKSKRAHVIQIRHRDEVEQSKYAFGQIDMPAAELHTLHRNLFDQYYYLGETLLRSNLLLPALDYCLKCSHMFNLLDASGGIGVTERMAYILKVRQMAVAIAKKWAGVEDGPRPDGSRPEDRHKGHKDHDAHKETK